MRSARNEIVYRLIAAVIAAGAIGAAPASAQLAIAPAGVTVYTMTAGRIASLAANLIGLTGAIVAGRALARRRAGPTAGAGRSRRS